MDEQSARDRVARLEESLAVLEESQDTTATEAIAGLCELYGEGLSRIAAQLSAELLEALASDELVAHLLMLHGLHPVPLETRVTRALEEVRPYLASHGGDVELVAVDGAVVSLRLQGTCDGCRSSATTLKLAVEDAIYKAAPDVERIETGGAEGLEVEDLSITIAGGHSPSHEAFALPAGASPLPLAGAGTTGAAASDHWNEATTLSQLESGGIALKWIGGQPVLLMAVDGQPFACRHLCPNCGQSLQDAALAGSELECLGCGYRYDVRAAGRCTAATGVSLEPLPLLVDDGGAVKVGVAG